ncbi:unnamed protein product, partial [Prorocentrum cordatum]
VLSDKDHGGSNREHSPGSGVSADTLRRLARASERRGGEELGAGAAQLCQRLSVAIRLVAKAVFTPELMSFVTTGTSCFTTFEAATAARDLVRESCNVLASSVQQAKQRAVSKKLTGRRCTLSTEAAH